jgi:hypothetical protein
MREMPFKYLLQKYTDLLTNLTSSKNGFNFQSAWRSSKKCFVISKVGGANKVKELQQCSSFFVFGFRHNYASKHFEEVIELNYNQYEI